LLKNLFLNGLSSIISLAVFVVILWESAGKSSFESILALNFCVNGGAILAIAFFLHNTRYTLSSLHMGLMFCFFFFCLIFFNDYNFLTYLSAILAYSLIFVVFGGSSLGVPNLIVFSLLSSLTKLVSLSAFMMLTDLNSLSIGLIYWLGGAIPYFLIHLLMSKSSEQGDENLLNLSYKNASFLTIFMFAISIIGHGPIWSGIDESQKISLVLAKLVFFTFAPVLLFHENSIKVHIRILLFILLPILAIGTILPSLSLAETKLQFVTLLDVPVLVECLLFSLMILFLWTRLLNKKIKLLW